MNNEEENINIEKRLKLLEKEILEYKNQARIDLNTNFFMTILFLIIMYNIYNYQHT